MFIGTPCREYIYAGYSCSLHVYWDTPTEYIYAGYSCCCSPGCYEQRHLSLVEGEAEECPGKHEQYVLLPGYWEHVPYSTLL